MRELERRFGLSEPASEGRARRLTRAGVTSRRFRVRPTSGTCAAPAFSLPRDEKWVLVESVSGSC